MKRTNKFLFAFLVVNLSLVLVSLLYQYKMMPHFNFPVITYIQKSSFILLGPLVYFYTKAICYSDFKFTKKNWLHFLGFFLMFAYFIVDYSIRSSNTNDITTTASLTLFSYSIYSVIFLLQLVIYIITSFLILKKYRQTLKTEYSSVENKELSWLQILLVVYFFHWLFDTLMFVFYIIEVKSPELFSILGILSILTLLIFSTWAVVKGLKQLAVFSGIEQKSKYADSTLSKSDSEMFVTELINYMETSQPYLEPSLKITELAQSLSIPSKSLSQSINQQLGKNFYDFVNSYRIEEAKSQIKKANGNGRTILEILYESGFNSKAAFNRAFKKHTGITPTEYKRSL
ncbi:MAG: helix-turn-helix domain-containing protein [Melioribacteraceae bacterium]